MNKYFSKLIFMVNCMIFKTLQFYDNLTIFYSYRRRKRSAHILGEDAGLNFRICLLTVASDIDLPNKAFGFHLYPGISGGGKNFYII